MKNGKKWMYAITALLACSALIGCEPGGNGDGTIYPTEIVLSTKTGTEKDNTCDMLLQESKTGTMVYTLNPANATSTISWKTTNKSVASTTKVDGTKEATITGKGEGTCQVYVVTTLSNGSTLESNKLTVKVTAASRKTNDDFEKGVLTYKDANQNEKALNMNTLYTNCNAPHLDPLTESHVMVVPFGFTDTSLQEVQTEEMRTKIEKTFLGTHEEMQQLGAWESLASFYNKSSYGKSVFSGKVLPTWCVYNGTASAFKSTYGNGLGIGAAEYARNWYTTEYAKEEHGALGADAEPISYFDANNDGFLDLVWVVYSQPTTNSGEWWAYVTYTGNTANYTKPTVKTLGFASVDWMAGGCNGYDPHTFIHETGHTYGLDDYYDYNATWAPMGGVDFMDHNLGDHNMFSKFSLGWTSPWVVNDDATITLRPGTTTGDCFIIPSPGYNGTAFDEYVMVELMAPVGLCETDYKNGYQNTSGYSKPGLRITHVDARVQSSSHYDWCKSADDLGRNGKQFRVDNSYMGRMGGGRTAQSDTDWFSVTEGKTTKKYYMTLLSLFESAINETDNWTTSSSYNATNATLFTKGQYFNLNPKTTGWAKTFMPSKSNLWNKASIKNKNGVETIDETCTFNYSLTVKDIKEDATYGWIATVQVNANAY